MRSLSSIISFALIVPAAVCYPSPPASDGLVAHEKRDIPATWQKRDRVHAKATLPMRVGLKQRNFDRGHAMLMEISDPASSNYAQHLSSDEIISLFEPDSDSVATVFKWLQSAGIHSSRVTHSDNRGWLAFDASRDEAEELLHTTFHIYEHKSTGSISTATDVYHVPEHITELIDYITPGVHLTPRAKRSQGIKKRTLKTRPKPLHHLTPADADGCDTLLTPECLAQLYQIPKGTKASPNNSLGIFEYGDFYDQEDLDSFYAAYATYIPKGTGPKVNAYNDASAPVSPAGSGIESMLDFCVAYPLVWPQGTTLFQGDDEHYSASTDKLGFFQNFLNAVDGSYCTYSADGETGNNPQIDPTYPDQYGWKGQMQCGVFKPTNVLSVSYGWVEMDLPVNYQLRQCNEFMKLALQGTTVLVASGDNGIAANTGEDTTNGCVGPKSTVFNPNYFSCPYVTNVGATKIMPGKTTSDPEQASDQFPSGGGFSNIFPIPDWQKSTLDSYFKEHNPPYESYSLPGGGLNANGVALNGGTIDANVTKIIGNGVYNRLGRGMPDVSANGENAAMYQNGYATTGLGTSMSTPVFASVINRINEERIAVGKKPVGFINPTLYAHPEVLNDIVGGSNGACSVAGFEAVQGWDPVTGLGTPNYPKMLSLFMSLP